MRDYDDDDRYDFDDDDDDRDDYDDHDDDFDDDDDYNNVKISNAGKKIKILRGYRDNEFEAEDFGRVLVTIDGSAVTHNLEIEGNWLANAIIGGSGRNWIDGGRGNDTLTGGKGNDSLFGGAGNDKLYGGNGNDTLRGGKGNDSLWGGDDDNVFVYAKSDGKDIIFGFEDDDMLKITGAFSASYNRSKGEISFKVGDTSNAITLKNFDTSTFNVNGNIYRISGSKLVKK